MKISFSMRNIHSTITTVTPPKYLTLGCRQDLTVKTARIQELEKAINEHQTELDHRQNQSKEYEEKLSKLQEQARIENERGAKLDHALQECQQEMEAHIEQLAEMKEHHENELNNKQSEVRRYVL